jgi:hypothetical protein
MRKPRRPALFLPMLMCIFLVMLTACSKEEKFVGTYRAAEGSPQEYKDLYVELKQGGEGIRRVRGEEVAFTWVAKNDEIRVHTKSGGVIVAKLKRDVLEVRLPGPKIVYLKRMN